MATEEQKAAAEQNKGILQGELGALGAISSGLGKFSTAGSDNFHRTNDVFGLGLEIDF